MNRRDFLGMFAGAVVVSAEVADQRAAQTDVKSYPAIERADGSRYLVGVAMETVHVGDLVQIQTRGSVKVNVKQ